MENKIQKIALIGAALGAGAQKTETELGPEVIHSSQSLQTELDSKPHSQAYWQAIVFPPEQIQKTVDYPQKLQLITQTVSKLAKETAKAIDAGAFPITVGGDHSIAIGTWSGVISALEAQKEFGLIWFDAHMDAHTPLTTPSMAIHGMPVAVLLGEGEPDLINIQSSGIKVDPKHLVLMGTRSFEEGEADLLKKLGVKIISAQDILDKGFEAACEEALQIVTKGTKGFGISIDLDGFDPIHAPGTGSHEANGLDPNKIMPQLSKLINDPRCKALEIAEFNPVLDEDHKTLALIETIIRQKIHHE